jgi:hypothetical protein
VPPVVAATDCGLLENVVNSGDRSGHGVVCDGVKVDCRVGPGGCLR